MYLNLFFPLSEKLKYVLGMKLPFSPDFSPPFSSLLLNAMNCYCGARERLNLKMPVLTVEICPCIRLTFNFSRTLAAIRTY